MKRTFLIASLVLVTVSACKRDEPAPAPTLETAAAITAPAPAAVADTATVAVAVAAFDLKGFAGTFKGSLPCTDCPGIDTTIELRRDGTATIGEQYQERRQHLEETGTWTVEADNTRVRFDPDSKTEQDRLYAIASKDQLTQLGADGTPAASGLDYSLRRSR